MHMSVYLLWPNFQFSIWRVNAGLDCCFCSCHARSFPEWLVVKAKLFELTESLRVHGGILAVLFKSERSYGTVFQMVLESGKNLQALAAQLASPAYLDRLLRSCLLLRSGRDHGYISNDLRANVGLSTHVTRCQFVRRPTASPSFAESALFGESSVFVASSLSSFILFRFAAVGSCAGWSWTTTRLSEDQWRCRWWLWTATATSRKRGRKGGEEQALESGSLQVGCRFGLVGWCFVCIWAYYVGPLKN